LPRKLCVVGARHRLPDLINYRGGYVCSDAFRDIVETLEPLIHQFESVDLVWKNGDLAAKYFYFIPCNRLFAVNEDLVFPPLRGKSKIWVADPKGNSRLVFLPDCIAEHHFWVDASLEGFLKCSGQAHDAIVSADLAGVAFRENEVK
jgi:hypothetical protein